MKSKTLIKTPRFSVVHDEDSNRNDYYYVKKPNAVGIIAIHDKRIILVKQYRHIIKRFTLELPGGRVETNETAGIAAKRELFEETGLVSKKIEKFLSVYPLPSITNERVDIFISKKNELKQPMRKTVDVDLNIVMVDLESIMAVLEDDMMICSIDAYALLKFYCYVSCGKIQL